MSEIFVISNQYKKEFRKNKLYLKLKIFLFKKNYKSLNVL